MGFNLCINFYSSFIIYYYSSNTMPKPQRYTAKQVATALEECSGIVQRAAASLDCHPSTVYRYVDRYSTVKEALDGARADTYALAEKALMEMVEDPTHRNHRWAVERVLQMFSPLVEDGMDYHTTEATAEASAQVVVQVHYPSDVPAPDMQ